MNLLAALLSVPFIQLGLSYYVSIAALAFVALLGAAQVDRSRPPNSTHLAPRVAVSTLILLICMINPDYTIQDAFRGVRQILFFFLVTHLMNSVLATRRSAIVRTDAFVFMMATAWLGLTIAQVFSLQRGVYLGIPTSYFSQNSATLPDDLALRFSSLRPSATFGEPSYFAFVCLGFIYSAAHKSIGQALRNPTALLLVCCIILSRSMNGIAGLILILAFSGSSARMTVAKLIQIAAPVLAATTLVLVTDNPLSERLADLGSKNDFSTFTRLILPVIYVFQTLPSYPLGQSFSGVISSGVLPGINVSGYDITDNSLTNFLIEFGVGGAALIAVLFACARDNLTRVFLLVACLQNGAVLSLDKCALIGLFVGLYNSRRLQVVAKPAPAVKPHRYGVQPAKAFSLASATIPAVGALILALLNTSQASAQTIDVVGGGRTAKVATIEAAFDEVVTRRRAGDHGDIRMIVPNGVWRITHPIVVTAEMASSRAGVLEIVGNGRDRTVITGSQTLQSSALDAATSGPFRSRSDLIQAQLPPSVRISAFDFERDVPNNQIVLTQGDRRLTLARWPATDLTTGRVTPTATPNVYRIKPDAPAEGSPLIAEPDPWIGGYWAADWAYEFSAARYLPESESFEVGPLIFHAASRPSARIFVANSFGHLQTEGTYVVDQRRNLIYMKPFQGSTEIEIAEASTLVRVLGASNLRVADICFERSTGDGIVVSDSTDVVFSNIQVRQVGRTGIVVERGFNVKIEGSVISETGGGGIAIRAGDRRKLVASNHSVVATLVENFGLVGRDYKAGVRVEGVGVVLNGNTIRHGYSSAVVLSGNEIDVLNNDVSDVLWDSDDAGAIYMGRDWTQRGIRITDNYIHDIGFGKRRKFVAGVYLDDQISGAVVADNVISNVPIGIVLGGGREIVLRRNWVLTPERGAINFDERGKDPRYARMQETLWERLKAMPVTSDVWRSRYPTVADLLTGDPSSAALNIVERNGVVNGRLWSAAPAPQADARAENIVPTVDVARVAEVLDCLAQRPRCVKGSLHAVIESFVR